MLSITRRKRMTNSNLLSEMLTHRRKVEIHLLYFRLIFYILE